MRRTSLKKSIWGRTLSHRAFARGFSKSRWQERLVPHWIGEWAIIASVVSDDIVFGFGKCRYIFIVGVAGGNFVRYA